MRYFSLFSLFSIFSYFLQFTRIKSHLNTLFLHTYSILYLLSILLIHSIHIVHRDSLSLLYSGRGYLKKGGDGEPRGIGELLNYDTWCELSHWWRYHKGDPAL